MDEIVSLYNMLPITSFAWDKIEGRKKDKTCVTITLTCNGISPEWFHPFFIGHAYHHVLKKRLLKNKDFSMVIIQRHG